MKSKYFSNAGASIMSVNTYNTIKEHLELEMQVGGYRAASLSEEKVSRFYVSAARLLNANNRSEIAFIDSASRGWNLVMYGLSITEKDTIVTLKSEYGTNLLTIYDIAKKTGCSVNVIDCNGDGSFDTADVEKALAAGGTILAVSHVTAQGSIVNPVVELGKLANRYGAIYIVDGCQAVGQIKADVCLINCDAYITAGRKWLRGPRGTGILYVRTGSSIHTPQIDLASSDLIYNGLGEVEGVSVRSDAKQFELWEKSIALLCGLTNAIEECLQYGEENISKELLRKSKKIRKAIINNSSLVLVGRENDMVGISSFYMKDPLRENQIKKLFDESEFVISYMCDWDCPLFFPTDGQKYIFRISPHYYTDDEDIESLCDLLSSLR